MFHEHKLPVSLKDYLYINYFLSRHWWHRPLVTALKSQGQDIQWLVHGETLSWGGGVSLEGSCVLLNVLSNFHADYSRSFLKHLPFPSSWMRLCRGLVDSGVLLYCKEKKKSQINLLESPRVALRACGKRLGFMRRPVFWEAGCLASCVFKHCEQRCDACPHSSSLSGLESQARSPLIAGVLRPCRARAAPLALSEHLSEINTLRYRRWRCQEKLSSQILSYS